MAITLNNTDITFSDGSAQIAAAKMLNVVQTVKYDVFTTASTTYVDIPGLSATITPKSTSNKILIFVAFTTSDSSYGVGTIYPKYFNLCRNGSAIGIGDARGSNVSCSTGSGAVYSANYPSNSNWISWMDSPATTSAVTYNVQCRIIGSVTLSVGGSYSSGNAYNSSTISTITLMEVAP